MKRIVVGLIDTPSSRAALRWAARQAAATGSLIEVVTCIQPLPSYVWSDVLLSAAPPLVTASGLRNEAAALQERVLRQEFGPQFGAVPLRVSVVAGEAATGLARAAVNADLLVVGRSRGRMRFLRRSIGDRCSQLFDGPVALIPPDHTAGGSGLDRELATIVLGDDSERATPTTENTHVNSGSATAGAVNRARR